MAAAAAFAALAGVAQAAGEAPEWVPLKTNDMLQSMAKLSKFMIWDGDVYGKGGRGWTHPTEACRVSITDEDAHSGKHSLLFDASGGAWMGFGFNFAGWWPPDAVWDISNYKNLSFWIRVDAAPKRGPNGLNVSLGCSGAKESNTVNVEDYAPGLMDGQWHEVVIPLKHLLNRTTDFTRIWEFRMGEWANGQRTFKVYIDEIGVDNRAD